MSSSSSRTAFLDLEFTAIRGRTFLTQRRHTWPFSLGREFHLRAQPAVSTVVIQTSSGTMNAGDTADTALLVRENAHAQILAQGAVSVHRADGDGDGDSDSVARENVRLQADGGAILEYLPEPRILFPRCRFRQRIDIDAAAGGIVLLVDSFAVILGKSGVGYDEYISEITIRSDGALLARERARAPAWPDLPPFARRLTACAQIFVVDPSGILPATQSPEESDDAYIAASSLPKGAGFAVRIWAVDGRVLRANIQRHLQKIREELLRRSAMQRGTESR